MNARGLRPSLGWRVRRFLGSAGHVVGMIAAIGGLILLNNGVISGPIGWALIAILYATGYFIAARPKLTALGQPRSGQTAKLSDQLSEVLAAIRGRVSDDIYYRVRSIRDAIVFTLESSGPQNEADPNIHMVRQTANSYLPEALSTYLSLPREYAEYQLVDGQKTSRDMLLDQLTLMDYKVRQVAEQVIARSSQELQTQGRFLADRFGESELSVDRNTQSGQAAAVPAALPETVGDPIAQPEQIRDRERVTVV